MARGGVNKAVVKIARDALLARGARPTIDAVRIELGNTGSKSTILRCLQELVEQETKRPEPSLDEELMALIGPVADRLREAAHASVAVEREALTRQELESRAQRQQSQDKIQELQQRNAELASQLQEQRQLELALRDQLQASEVERSRLQELEQGLRLLADERALQVESLEEKHQHAREALAHYRQSQKEQRAQELQRHDEQRQLLHREVRALQEGLLQKQSQLEGLNRANERLLAEARNQAQQLYLAERETAQLRVQLADASHVREQQQASWQEALGSAQSANATLQERLKRQATEYRHCKRLLNVQIRELRELRIAIRKFLPDPAVEHAPCALST